MKKLFALMLALIMALSLVACGGGGEAADDGAADGAADAAKVVVFWYDESDVYLGSVRDALNKEFNARPYSSQAAYDADLKAVNEVYMDALPCFEKALAIKPNDPDTLEVLKSLCFRLRDEEGMMDKYNHYNALFKKAKGLE